MKEKKRGRLSQSHLSDIIKSFVKSIFCTSKTIDTILEIFLHNLPVNISKRDLFLVILSTLCNGEIHMSICTNEIHIFKNTALEIPTRLIYQNTDTAVLFEYIQTNWSLFFKQHVVYNTDNVTHSYTECKFNSSLRDIIQPEKLCLRVISLMLVKSRGRDRDYVDSDFYDSWNQAYSAFTEFLIRTPTTPVSVNQMFFDFFQMGIHSIITQTWDMDQDIVPKNLIYLEMTH